MVQEPGQRHAGNGREPTSHRKRGRQPRVSYPVWSPDPGFLPQGRPLPWRDAVRQLPRCCRLVLTRPGFEPFVPAAGQGGWAIVCIQLLVTTVGAAGLALLRAALFPAPSSGGVTGAGVAQALTAGASAGLLIPFLFFFTMGLLYWLARAAGGHGAFVQQLYTTLLFVMPCGLLVGVLGLVPFAGDFLSAFLGVILFVYCIVLQCFATIAVHHIKGGQATAVTVITALSLIPVSILCLALWMLLVHTIGGTLAL